MLENDKNNHESHKEENTSDLIPFPEKEIKYGETPYRWFFLISYSLSAFSNQMQWVTFSSIATDFSNNYEISLWKVNMFSLIYMITNLILSLPEAWMLDKFSIRFTLIFAAGCNIIGSGLKLLVNKDNSLVSCYIGQILASLFQPYCLIRPGKLLLIGLGKISELLFVPYVVWQLLSEHLLVFCGI